MTLFNLTFFSYGLGLTMLAWVAGLVVGFVYNIISRAGRA